MVHAAAVRGIPVELSAWPAAPLIRIGDPALLEVFVFPVKLSLTRSSPTCYSLTYTLLLVIAG